MRRIAIPGVLLGLVGIAPAPVAGAVSLPAGFSAPTQRLVKGCGWYHYSYWVKPGDNDWLLQVRITDAGGTAQGFQFFTSGDPGDPTSATVRFQLCSTNARAPRRLRLVGQLDLNNGSTQTATALPTVAFTIAPATAKHAVTKHHKKRKHPKRRKAHA